MAVFQEIPIRTLHVTTFAWRLWKPCGDIPDLSPGSVQSNLLLTVRDAVEMAAGDVIGPVARKAESAGTAYSGPRCLDDIYQAAFCQLDVGAMKQLKKIFDNVMKNYFTVIFTDPNGKNKDFLAYASPGMYYDLEELAARQLVSEEDNAHDEFQAKLNNMRGNACTCRRGFYICGQPVSGRSTCSYWHEPEEGNPYQCYFQDRNPDQSTLEDGLLCQCEEAWEECNPQVNKSAEAN